MQKRNTEDISTADISKPQKTIEKPVDKPKTQPVASSNTIVHIDQDDDITSLMTSVKTAKADTVKLVSPKNCQAITSPINLKLLSKAAKAKDKKLVLVTRDRSVLNLAGGLGILTAADVNAAPSVSKVQRRPEPEPEDQELNDEPEPREPVEDSEPAKPETSTPPVQESKPSPQALAAEEPTKKPKKEKSKKAVPTIDSLRKRVFVGILVLFLLGGLWWYLTRVTPSAEVLIEAQTQRVPVKVEAAASNEYLESDPSRKQLKPSKVDRTVTEEIEFQATGEKNVGQPASGKVQVSNCSESDAFTIKSGTTFSSDGKNFKSTSEVLVPGAAFSSGDCTEAGKASVDIKSDGKGADYNLEKGSKFAIEGVNGEVSASATANFSGGSSEIVKIISQSDIDQASQTLFKRRDQSIKSELIAKFDDSYTVIDDSFDAVASDVSSSPAVGEEVEKGRAKVDITYSILAIKDADIKELLGSVAAASASDGQGVTDDGFAELAIVKTSQSGPASMELSLTTDAFVGPVIDIGALSTDIAGMQYSDALNRLKSIDGVNNVDIDLSFFAFGKLPGEDKIDIRLNVSDHPTSNDG